MAIQSIQSLLSKNFATVPPTSKAKAALIKLKDPGVNSVLVVENNTPIGIITKGDVYNFTNRDLSFDNALTKDVMNPNLITFPLESDVGIIKHAMEKLSLTCIPIVKNGEVQGTFTEKIMMSIYARNVPLVATDDEIPLSMVETLASFVTKLESGSETLSNSEVCDLLAFQDFLLTHVDKNKSVYASKLLDATYLTMVVHLSKKYGYEKNDADGLLKYLLVGNHLKSLPRYSKDFIAYQRILDNQVGNLTLESYAIKLAEALSQ